MLVIRSHRRIGALEVEDVAAFLAADEPSVTSASVTEIVRWFALVGRSVRTWSMSTAETSLLSRGNASNHTRSFAVAVDLGYDSGAIIIFLVPLALPGRLLGSFQVREIGIGLFDRGCIVCINFTRPALALLRWLRYWGGRAGRRKC